MSRSLIVSNANSLPVPISGPLRDRLAAGLSRLDPEGLGYSIALADAPSPELRSALKTQSDDHAVALRAAGAQVTTRILGKLAIALKKRTRSDREADAAFAIYVENLADLPTFALEAAAADFIRGDAGDGWMPDVPDLRKQALAKVQPPAAEKIRIDRLLNARVREAPISEEKRAATLAYVRETVSILCASTPKGERARPESPDVRRQPSPEADEAELAALLDSLTDRPPASLSDEARKMFVK